GLAEHFFELVDEAFGQRMVQVLTADACELFEQLALAGAQAFRRLDHDLYQFVAAPITVQIYDAFTLEAQYLAGLRTGRNSQFDLAFEGRNVDFRSDRCLRKADRHLDYDVVVLPDEHRMLADMDYDV